jgi:hypothetical protein
MDETIKKVEITNWDMTNEFRKIDVLWLLDLSFPRKAATGENEDNKKAG